MGRNKNRRQHRKGAAAKENAKTKMNTPEPETTTAVAVIPKIGGAPMPTDLAMEPTKYGSAFVRGPVTADGTTRSIGALGKSYWLQLRISEATGNFITPHSRTDSGIPKGELFNRIMHDCDSSWPYEGENFKVRDKVPVTERVSGDINVTPALWYYPSIWPFTIPLLARQLGFNITLAEFRPAPTTVAGSLLDVD